MYLATISNFRPKSRSVPFVTTLRAKIPTRLYSAMVATWQFIKVCLIAMRWYSILTITDCYGVPYIPEGQWLCRKCEVAPGHPVECVLCPNEGGAFKQTTSGDWVHLLCVLWTPNATLENGQTMEPAVISNVDPKREKLKCIICNLANNGTCIQCRKGQCPVAYHVTCARKWKLLLPMKGTTDLSHYCPTHLPVRTLIRLFTCDS